MKRQNLKEILTFYFLLAITILGINGCTIQYVAEYDESIKNEIIRISAEIDKFYGILLETAEAARTYINFKDEYLTIEVDLRTLLTRNKIRPLNEESVKQTEIVLDLWLNDKEQHKTNDSVSDFIIKQHRNQFQRIFIAMAIGEEVKEE
ncbi:MAG: hypothetical protein Q7S39_06105 [Ignavibacteria bacterium]|nr:hypothetical protein [Ignavibacteria bacterium]